MKNKNNNPHAGSSFESFLKEAGIFEEVKAAAIKQLIALQLRDEMEKKNLTHKAMAERMGTSRSQLQRLLDPKNVSVTLLTLEKAASALGKNLEISLK